jgi:hypothetical protein
MAFITFLRSGPGRVLRVAIGLLLMMYGATQASMVGLIMLIVGMVPAVTALAGVCLIEEVVMALRSHYVRPSHVGEHRA